MKERRDKFGHLVNHKGVAIFDKQCEQCKKENERNNPNHSTNTEAT